MNTNHERNYAEQRNAGRVMEEGFTPRRPLLKATNKVTPKGHEAFLKALEASGANVDFELAASGNIVSGSIKTSDKYTISIQEQYGTRVLFKHDISNFFVLAPTTKEVH